MTNSNANTANTLPSRNEHWGFIGTTRLFLPDALAAWQIASRLIAEETTCSPEGVRDFLDSRMGRHFADMVVDNIGLGLELEAAIACAIDRHQRWTISARTEREEGIPAGLPLLTGRVTQFGVLADMAAEERA